MRFKNGLLFAGKLTKVLLIVLELPAIPSLLIETLLQRKLIHKSVGTLIVATIYLQLIQNRYMFRSFTLL